MSIPDQSAPEIEWPVLPDYMRGLGVPPNRVALIYRILIRLESAGVDVKDHESCWIWPKAKSDLGYGTVGNGAGGQSRYVHRIMYEECVGLIPGGYEIDHRCHVEDTSCTAGNDCRHRACCNPGHLRAITGLHNRKNIRGAKRGKCETGQHVFDPETAIQGRCRPCVLAEGRARQQAAKFRRIAAGLPPYPPRQKRRKLPEADQSLVEQAG